MSIETSNHKNSFKYADITSQEEITGASGGSVKRASWNPATGKNTVANAREEAAKALAEHQRHLHGEPVAVRLSILEAKVDAILARLDGGKDAA